MGLTIVGDDSDPRQESETVYAWGLVLAQRSAWRFLISPNFLTPKLNFHIIIEVF